MYTCIHVHNIKRMNDLLNSCYFVMYGSNLYGHVFVCIDINPMWYYN